LSHEIQLIVDTNLFHECHSLVRDDFPWRAIGDFDVIKLVVPEAVQTELDRQKKDSRPRIKRRALEAVSWFRELLENNLDEKVLRESNPRVTLRVDVTAPSSSFPHLLDNSVPDDRIVNVAATLAAAEPTMDVRLLTHDTRPAAKARAVNLRFLFVPDAWIREPGQDESQKEIQRLQDENKRLRATSPELSISVNEVVDKNVTLRRTALASLTTEEVNALRNLFAERYPLSKLQQKLNEQRLLNDQASEIYSMRGHYIEPSEEQIERYRSVTYPEWAESCICALEAVPRAINLVTSTQPLTIVLRNSGSRPAENVLIRFAARGPFLIAPPPLQDPFAPHLPELPEPPLPPRGHWLKDGVQVVEVTRGLDNFSDFTRNVDFPLSNFIREDEIFYYEPKRPDAPVEAFSIISGRLRHGLDPKVFEIEVFPQEDKQEIRGAIELQVSASNVSDVQSLIVPINVLSDCKPAFEAVRKVLDAVDFFDRFGRRSPFYQTTR
jgi:hypothetical protein